MEQQVTAYAEKVRGKPLRVGRSARRRKVHQKRRLSQAGGIMRIEGSHGGVKETVILRPWVKPTINHYHVS